MEAREITIDKQPIELIPGETFKIVLSWPITHNLNYDISYLEGVFLRAQKCDCPIKTLMENGCQCGGS